MKKKASPVLAGLVLLVAAAVALLSGPLLDRAFAPWAFAQGGRPPLTGSWVGRLTTATGQSRGILLTLILPEPGGRSGLRRSWRTSPYGTLGGTASVCDERGEVQAYTVDGRPGDREASQITFHAAPSEAPPPDGLTLSWVNGAWDGADRLDLAAQLFWSQNGAAISGASYPDTQAEAPLPMARGGEAEFRALCEQVRSGGE